MSCTVEDGEKPLSSLPIWFDKKSLYHKSDSQYNTDFMSKVHQSYIYERWFCVSQ